MASDADADEDCFKDNKVTSVLIDPLETNHRAIRFYERIGFQLVEQRTFEESRCLVYKLDREDWMKKEYAAPEGLGPGTKLYTN